MNIPRRLNALVIAGLIGTAPMLAVPAMAQQAAPSAEEVTTEEIDSFVLAYNNVNAVNEEYTQRIQQAGDQNEAQSLRDEAQTKMTEAVEETPGIDVDRYLEILTIAQADPELNAAIVSKLQE